MVTELEKMTVDEIKQYMMMGSGANKRKPTPEEAQHFHDMIHKTEKTKKTFTMNDVEHARAVVFAAKHKNCTSKSAMNEKFEYRFVPGGIGIAVCITCLICKEEKNVTDFDCW